MNDNYMVTEPPKKHTTGIIIGIVAGVLLIAGALAFAVFALPQITGQQNKLSELVHIREDENTPQQVVRDFQTAFNQNDKEAMTRCFLPAQNGARSLQGSGVKLLNDLIATFGGATPQLSFELTGLQKDGDTATGTVIITADLPILGTQSKDFPVTFKKQDYRWYFDKFMDLSLLQNQTVPQPQ
ncbi:MAG: hypothetical protein II615_00400 [Ruminococcus sp.]|nr:hypothetical protein [Ruminococcus sp.]